MDRLVYSSKSNPCPVCGRSHDKDCRWRDGLDMVLCHTHMDGSVGEELNGFHYAGSSRDTWGVWIADELWWEKPIRPAGVRQWEYWTKDSTTRLVTIIRKDDGHGTKNRWQDWNVDKDQWREEVGLYRLEECQKAQSEGQIVVWVEGEPAADALWKIGIPATTSIGGCGQYDVWGSYKGLLDDSLLALSPDRDRKGIEYMERVEQDFPAAQWLYCQPNHPLWCHLTEGGGFDAEDWIDMGATKEQVLTSIGKKNPDVHQKMRRHDDYDTIMETVGKILLESEEQGRAEYRVAKYCQENDLRKMGFTPTKLIAAYREYQEKEGILETVTVEDLLGVEEDDLNSFLITGLLPAGTTVLFGAQGGSGKTVFTYQMAGAIASGTDIWGRKVQQGNVLIIQADEPINSMRRKFRNLGFKNIQDSIQVVTRYRQTTSWFRQVKEMVKRDKIKLIILDSVTAVTAGLGGDRTSSSAGDWMYAWRDMCQDLDCTAIFIHHLSKAGDFRDSSSYVDNVRETWKLTPAQEQQDRGKMAEQWELAIEKSNADLQGRYCMSRNEGVFGWQLEGVTDEAGRTLSKSILAKLDEDLRWHSQQDLNASLGQSTVKWIEQLRRMGMVRHRNLHGIPEYASHNIDGVVKAPVQPIKEESNVIGLFDLEDHPMSEKEADDAVELINKALSDQGDGKGAVELLMSMRLNSEDKALIWGKLSDEAKQVITRASKAA